MKTRVQADKAGGIIGRNIRPGMTPGGFSAPMGGPRTLIRRTSPTLTEELYQVRESANALLEGRANGPENMRCVESARIGNCPKPLSGFSLTPAGEAPARQPHVSAPEDDAGNHARHSPALGHAVCENPA